MALKDFNLEAALNGAEIIVKSKKNPTQYKRARIISTDIQNYYNICIAVMLNTGEEYVMQANNEGKCAKDANDTFYLKIFKEERIPFSLDIYLTGDKVETVEGFSVDIFTTKARGEHPVVGQIEGLSSVYQWSRVGRNGLNSDNDLVIIK